MKEISRKLQEMFERAKSDRMNFQNQWDDIQVFFRPNRGDIISEQAQGTFRDPALCHPAPVNVVNKLSARITSDVTDIALNGFRLQNITETLGELTEEMAWADLVSRKMRALLQLPEVNFQSANAMTTGDCVTYGTGVLSMFPTDKPPYVKFKPVHIGRVWLMDNYNGIVDTVFEKLVLSGRQAYQMFGEKLSKDLLAQINEKPTEKISIIKAVMPAEDARKWFNINVVQEYALVYFEESNCHFIEESSIDYFPYKIARWEVKTGEVYGRSPASDGLPYARRITHLSIMRGRALQRYLDPHLLTTDDNVLPKRRLTTGMVIDGGIDGLTRSPNMQYMPFPADPSIALQEEQYLVAMLEQLFYVQGLPDNKNVRMTQVEVQARLAELKAMSPNISRIINEYLYDIAITLYKIWAKKKVLPAKPQGLKDVEFKFNFLGSLTNVFKFAEAESIQQIYNLLAVIGQFDPNTIGLIKHEKVLAMLAEIYNAPVDMVKSSEEVAAEREQQAQQQAALQQAQLAEQYSNVAANVTKANVPFGGQ